VARGTRSRTAARDSDFASTVLVKAKSSAVSSGSPIWIIFGHLMPPNVLLGDQELRFKLAPT
jgi:hypothetical protein